MQEGFNLESLLQESGIAHPENEDTTHAKEQEELRKLKLEKVKILGYLREYGLSGDEAGKMALASKDAGMDQDIKNLQEELKEINRQIAEFENWNK